MSSPWRVPLVLLLGLAAALALAVPSSGAEGSICTATSGKVAMEVVTVRPGQVSPSTAARPSYTQLGILVENCGPSTKNGAVLDIGMAIEGAPQGCAVTADDRCSLGTLRGGTQYPVTLSAIAPEALGPVGPATLRYADESSNPSEPEGGLEIATAGIALTVGVQEGAASTWVPANIGTTLVASAGGQVAEVEIPQQGAGFEATLGRDTLPFPCPKKLVCRTGPAFTADILDGAPLAGGLRHTLTWPSTALDRRQTVRNLVVLHQLDNGQLNELRAPCAGTDTDCVESASFLADGSLRAVVRTRTNGRMR